MELVVEELESLKRKLDITIPEDIVTARVDNAYKELNRQMTMPGFRPGKIPRHIMEKQFPPHNVLQFPHITIYNFIA